MLRLGDAGQVALPPLPKLPAKDMAGPTPWSNWVIPARVIAGAYPASLDDAETERILTTLLELGINTFVCLQAEVNINTPEHAWRAQHGLRPYIKDAQKILSKAHETGNPRITQQKIDFLHLPVIDGNVTTDSAMNRLAEDCMERVLKGEKMYIHCWGGHGRTGTLVAVMLGRLYNMPYTTALRYTQAFHDSRVYPQGVRSPQTPVQRAQVRRLLAAQSAVASSAPTLLTSAARAPVPATAGVVRPSAAPAVGGARPSPGAVYNGSQKPITGAGSQSVLASAGTPAFNGASRQGLSSADVRASQAPPSPLRSRVSSGATNVSRPYGVRGENPARVSSSVDLRPGELSRGQGDKLISEFGKLQAGGRSSVGAYALAR